MSYLVHFMGKSTWRSGEDANVTRRNDSAYRQCFGSKWGTLLAEMLLAGPGKSRIAERYGVAHELAHGDFAGLLSRLENINCQGAADDKSE